MTKDERIKDLERVLDAVRHERASEGRAAVAEIERMASERDEARAEVERLQGAIAGLLSALDDCDPDWRKDTLTFSADEGWDDVNAAWVVLVASASSTLSSDPPLD